MARLPSELETLAMILRFPRRSGGSRARASRACPKTLVRKTCSQVSAVTDAREASVAATPALLISTSTGPSSARAKASNVPGRVTSSRTTFAPARAADEALSGSRTAAITLWPRRSSCCTNSAPSPRDAPVTRYLSAMRPRGTEACELEQAAPGGRSTASPLERYIPSSRSHVQAPAVPAGAPRVRSRGATPELHARLRRAARHPVCRQPADSRPGGRARPAALRAPPARHRAHQGRRCVSGRGWGGAPSARAGERRVADGWRAPRAPPERARELRGELAGAAAARVRARAPRYRPRHGGDDALRGFQARARRSRDSLRRRALGWPARRVAPASRVLSRVPAGSHSRRSAAAHARRPGAPYVARGHPRAVRVATLARDRGRTAARARASPPVRQCPAHAGRRDGRTGSRARDRRAGGALAAGAPARAPVPGAGHEPRDVSSRDAPGGSRAAGHPRLSRLDRRRDGGVAQRRRAWFPSPQPRWRKNRLTLLRAVSARYFAGAMNRPGRAIALPPSSVGASRTSRTRNSVVTGTSAHSWGRQAAGSTD